MFSKKMKANLDYYEEIKDELEQNNFGRIALLHDGKLISIYNDEHDAYQTGCDRFGLGDFAIKVIGQPPISLGINTICMANS